MALSCSRSTMWMSRCFSDMHELAVKCGGVIVFVGTMWMSRCFGDAHELAVKCGGVCRSQALCGVVWCGVACYVVVLCCVCRGGWNHTA